VSLADKSILLERFNETTIRDLGLPIIPTKEVPTCGTDPVLPPCSRKGSTALQYLPNSVHIYASNT